MQNFNILRIICVHGVYISHEVKTIFINQIELVNNYESEGTYDTREKTKSFIFILKVLDLTALTPQTSFLTYLFSPSTSHPHPQDCLSIIFIIISKIVIIQY